MRPLLLSCFAIIPLLAGCAVVDLSRPPAVSDGIPDSDRFAEGPERAVILALGTVVERGTLSSGFGWRGVPLGGRRSAQHAGIDISAPKGTPVRAAASGIVADIGTRGDYGRLVVIRHSNVLETAYAHLAHTTKNLRVGGPVGQGDIIGYVGTTGRATGPHLHFEVRKDGTPIDPLELPRASTTDR